MLEIKELKKTYHDKEETEVLTEVNLKLGETGLYFIVGKSGSGKTTLLNILGGFDSDATGEVIVDNENVLLYDNKKLNDYRKNKIGFVFQSYNLISSLNVYDNIAMPSYINNEEITDDEIETILDKLDIKKLKNRSISTLSGGEQQRVAIARAYIKKPTYYVMNQLDR